MSFFVLKTAALDARVRTQTFRSFPINRVYPRHSWYFSLFYRDHANFKTKCRTLCQFDCDRRLRQIFPEDFALLSSTVVGSGATDLHACFSVPQTTREGAVAGSSYHEGSSSRPTASTTAGLQANIHDGMGNGRALATAGGNKDDTTIAVKEVIPNPAASSTTTLAPMKEPSSLSSSSTKATSTAAHLVSSVVSADRGDSESVCSRLSPSFTTYRNECVRRCGVTCGQRETLFQHILQSSAGKELHKSQVFRIDPGFFRDVTRDPVPSEQEFVLNSENFFQERIRHQSEDEKALARNGSSSSSIAAGAPPHSTALRIGQKKEESRHVICCAGRHQFNWGTPETDSAGREEL